ncbi:MAG: hypothetical protein LBI77_02130, partial [Puniceicoccales bacterium]|nr:hypothetical protein [Puniceicoccales bacterium]
MNKYSIFKYVLCVMTPLSLDMGSCVLRGAETFWDRLSNIGNFAGEHQLTTLLSLKDRDIVITKKCFENLQQS